MRTYAVTRTGSEITFTASDDKRDFTIPAGRATIWEDITNQQIELVWDGHNIKIPWDSFTSIGGVATDDQVDTLNVIRGRLSTILSADPQRKAVIAAQTNSTGSSFTAFADVACSELDIVNNSGVDIEIKIGSETVYIQIPTGGGRLVDGITNASQVSIRRVDQSNSQVTIQAQPYA